MTATGHTKTPSSVVRAYDLANSAHGRVRLTNLNRTSLGDVQSDYFRFFTPVKRDRMRLPTSLPEFHPLRHIANLSDSPVTAAGKLGGHWSDYNLAAITQVSGCNFRCPYCYVEYRHLAGADNFEATATEIVDDFVRLREKTDTRLSMLRVSGGEPLLVPGLLVDIHAEIGRRALLDRVLLKVETNLSVLTYSFGRLPTDRKDAVQAIAPELTLHTTLHATPRTPNWDLIYSGFQLAHQLGFDLYPAIGGTGWTARQLRDLFDDLHAVHPAMPLRLAVRPFELSYDVLRGRRRLPTRAARAENSSLAWEQILVDQLGTGYLERPRHLVKVAQ